MTSYHIMWDVNISTNILPLQILGVRCLNKAFWVKTTLFGKAFLIVKAVETNPAQILVCKPLLYRSSSNWNSDSIFWSTTFFLLSFSLTWKGVRIPILPYTDPSLANCPRRSLVKTINQKLERERSKSTPKHLAPVLCNSGPQDYWVINLSSNRT